MSVNFLGLFKDTIGDQIAQGASGFIGESAGNTKSAIGAILPALIGGLMKKGAEDGGAARVLDYIHTHKLDGSILENLSAHFSGGKGTNALLESGSGLLDFIFGKDSSLLDNILDLIVGSSGIGKNSSQILVKIISPLLLGVIGRYVQNKNMDAVGLGKLLNSQGEHLKLTAPAGLIDKMGISDLISTPDKESEDGVKSATNQVSSRNDTASEVTESTEDSVASTSPGATQNASRIIPWIILGTTAILLWYFMRSCGGQPTDTVNIPPGNQEKVTESATVESDEVAAMESDKIAHNEDPNGEKEIPKSVRSVVNGMASLQLPGDIEVSFAEGSFLDQIYSYIVSAETDPSKRFSFDYLNFEGESAKITDSSMEELQKTAAILDAFPNVKIRVEGHTDNRGNGNRNLTISEQRSLAVKRTLNELGVSIERLRSAGLGETKPIESNDTEEGRKQNQRIDFFVTEK